MESIPLSALQHWLYCPRQCALIHNEQVWAENQFTAEGQLLHKRANEGPDEHRSSGTILRALHVSSEKHGISGICDIVEIQYLKSTMLAPKSTCSVRPVEYKRGKPKSHRADEVQVCAQAICLEEMFQTEIPLGLIFYGKTRRRAEVIINQELRALTFSTIAAVHEMKRSGITPLAKYDPGKCDACSLINHCQPKAMRLKRGAGSWFQSCLTSYSEAGSSLEI